MGKPEKIAVLLFEIVHGIHFADGSGDLVSAPEKLFRHMAAKTAIHAGNKPGSLCRFLILPSLNGWNGSAVDDTFGSADCRGLVRGKESHHFGNFIGSVGSP